MTIDRPLVYLGCPYSDPDPAVREARFRSVNRVAVNLMRTGAIVFSPISHCHPLAAAHGLPTDFEFWREFDRAYLACSSEMVVLREAGWRDSKGLMAELAIADEFDLPVRYVDPIEPSDDEVEPEESDEVIARLRVALDELAKRNAEIGEELSIIAERRREAARAVEKYRDEVMDLNALLTEKNLIIENSVPRDLWRRTAAEVDLLREVCAIPQGGVVRKRDDGEIVWSTADANGFSDGVVLGPTEAQKRIDRLYAENNALRDRVDRLSSELDAMRYADPEGSGDSVERLRVQLAGCLVAAEGNATGKNDAEPGSYGYSESFRAVRELRGNYDRAKAELDEARALFADYTDAPLADMVRDLLEENGELHDSPDERLAPSSKAKPPTEADEERDALETTLKMATASLNPDAFDAFEYLVDLLSRERNLGFSGGKGTPANLFRGLRAIDAERRRQVFEEGRTAEHDDGHTHAELAIAAAELLTDGTDAKVDHPEGFDRWGLVEKHGFKATGGALGRMRALAIAGALVAAEIDRVDRERRIST